MRAAGALVALGLLGACAEPPQEAPEALIELDRAASAALEQEVAALPAAAEAAAAALAARGFACGPDATRAGAAACQRTMIEGACALTGVVGFAPGAPRTARVFRACWADGVPADVRAAAQAGG